MPSYFFHIHFDLLGTNQPDHQNPPDFSPQLDNHITAGSNSKSHSELRPLPSKIPSSLDHSSVADDWRYDRCYTQTVAMTALSASDSPDHNSDTASSELTTTGSPGSITNGISAGPGGQTTKGRFEPYGSSSQQDLGWGVIRLYRGSEETPGLYEAPKTKTSKKARASAGRSGFKDTGEEQDPAFKDEECTTLCILAVPSYIRPSDFLGFVGEKTREDVSHFRMVRTERANRYMVLMKFRNGKRAREWRREWNGKPFDDLQTENLHVVFIRSILFSGTPTTSNDSFPDMRYDPFTPSITSASTRAMTTKPLPSISASRSSKPAPPPTPSLIELPTCPVCLERMDESTGLLTIVCQHVFHCSCLEKWRGSGCPVCRYTQEGKPTPKRSGGVYTGGEDDTGTNECRVCHAEENLWICLICGHTGCGRYDLAHAFAHHEASGHCFAMDMDTQRVWDYARDGYVHRILQDKSDGKFLELDPPDHHPHPNGPTTATAASDDTSATMIPQSKLSSITLEYTSLLTSQLESQRLYFEDVIARISTKASHATTAAESLTTTVSTLEAQLADLHTLQRTTVPALERDLEREKKRGNVATDLARNLRSRAEEEKSMNAGLMARIRALEDNVGTIQQEREGWAEERAAWDREREELKEQTRDLMLFLEGREKVKELEGTELGEEVRGGFVEVAADAPGGAEVQGKRKGKGKKGRK